MEITTDEGNRVTVDAATVFSAQPDDAQNSQDTDEFDFVPQAPGRLWGTTILATSDGQLPVRIAYLRLSDAGDDQARLTAKANTVITRIQTAWREGRPTLDIHTLL